MPYLYLSYFINENTPIYGGEKAVFIEKRSEMSKGDSSNTKYLKFPNHAGTHIDFPNHFSDLGDTINNYDASFWFTDKVYIIDYEAKNEEIIDDKILNNKSIPIDTEFIILNTGFYKKRNKKKYWNNNPGLAPDLAGKLKIKCPKLRYIGFDFISLTSYQNRLLGRKSHVEFLIKHNILLIEDMDLSKLKDKRIISITALPLMFDFLDGSPISIIAKYESN